MPESIKYEFDQKAFDAVQWFQYFRAHQQEYLRKRLRTVKLFAENQDVATIARTLSLNKNTVYIFLKLYLREGFEGLCRPAIRPKPTRLTTVNLSCANSQLNF